MKTTLDAAARRGATEESGREEEGECTRTVVSTEKVSHSIN